jgi:hypothetical protein
MDNQQPEAQQPLRQTLSIATSQHTSVVQYVTKRALPLSRSVHDMLVTMGVPTNAPPDAAPEAIRAVNDGMFRVTKQVQTALKWYGQGRYNDLIAQARGVNAVHRDEADADIFNIDE